MFLLTPRIRCNSSKKKYGVRERSFTIYVQYFRRLTDLGSFNRTKPKEKPKRTRYGLTTSVTGPSSGGFRLYDVTEESESGGT